MLAAQMRFGNETCSNFPLESMLIEEVTFAIWVLNSFNRLLLLMFRVAQVLMLRPSRLLRNVFVTKTSWAVEMTAGNVRVDRAGREFNEMF